MTLESKEIPSRWWRIKGGDLSPGARQVLRAVLRGFLDHGTAPSPAALERVAGAACAALEAVLTELVGHDMLVADAATGAVLGAYPFSGAATAHRVAIDGLATVSAMCAVDALGIPFLVNRPATIRSRDVATDEPLHVRIDPATARVVANPPGIVVFAGSTSSEGTAAEYRDAHPELDGRIVSLDDAVDWSRRVFEDPDGLVTG